MEKLIQKHEYMTKALKTLQQALHTFALFNKEHIKYNPHITYEEELATYRDSVIQRFEYSVDLFWKYLKKYLENANLSPDIKIPSEIIRTANSHGLISLDEAETIITMIKSRNMTSHIYVEEFANLLAEEIPKYYETLNLVINKLTPVVSNE